MSWISAILIKLFTNWSLVDFSRGVIINVFSAIVTSGSSKVLSKVSRNKNEEEQLMECFVRAVKRNVKNEEIAKYIGIHDEEKYRAALKKELLVNEHSFSSDSSDAKIVADFQKELSKKPFFATRLIKMYGQEICSTSNEVLDKMNEQIRGIQKIRQQGEQIIAAVQAITARTGYTLNITDSMTGDFDCPIPDLHFSRTSLVKEVKNKLTSHGAFYLYGGYKVGKSILCCLVAETYNDYAKVRIPLDYKNILSIKDIVQRYDVNDKILFIIDGIPYQDEAIITDLCQFITHQDTAHWLFLLNGRQPLSHYCVTPTGIDEYLIPALTQEEIDELVPQRSKSLTIPITALSSGSPMIAILMLQMLEKQGWPSTVQALYSLFGFSPQATFNDKSRSILKQIIPNRDAVRLLNRLLLIHQPFTRDQSRYLAGIDPAISLPDSCFDDLNNVAITDKGNGEYVIVPTLEKTLTPDLIQRERYNCDHWLAEQIISKKSINEQDIVRALNYMLDGGEYDRAGFFFINCLTQIGSNTASYRLLNGIWIDLPLPQAMSTTVKVLIRIQQIILFCIQPLKSHAYPVGDLEHLLQETDIEQNLRYFSYQILYYYYGMQGDVERSSKYVEAADAIPANPSLRLFGGDTLWMALYKVKTTSDLFSWFDMYAKEGYPAYDFKEEISNTAVSNIYQACERGDAVEQLKAVIQRAETKEGELWPFIVSAQANLIFYYGSCQQYQDAETIYRQTVYLDREFGKLLLNYAMGMCYYNNSRFDEAEPYFKQVTEIEDISLNAINVLYSYIFYAAIQKDKNPQEAVTVLNKLSSHPQFEKFFVESERVLLYAELAIALWNNNERPEAVVNIQKVDSYLWSCKDNMSDTEKNMFVRLSVVVSAYYGQMKGLPVNADYMQPAPSMFILINEKLKDEYSDFRVLATSIYLYELQREYLWEGGYSMTLLDHSLDLFRSSVIESREEYITLFLGYLPELLTNERYDDVKYIISQSSRAVQKFPGVIKHPEGAVLVGSLFYVLLYRLDKRMKGEAFDDSSLISILSDFITVTPQDCSFAKYLLDVMEGREQLNVSHSDDPSHQSLLVFYSLFENPSVNQWFVALQRMYMSLITMNNSHTCGQFLETISTDLLNHVVTAFPTEFIQGQYQKTVDKMKRYTLFERARAVLAGFYYLMKNPPSLNREVEQLIDI